MLRSEILFDFKSRRTVKIWLYRWLFQFIDLRSVGTSCHGKFLFAFFVVSRSCWLDVLRHFQTCAGYLIMKKCFIVNDWNFCWMCYSTRFLKCSSRWVESNTRPEEKQICPVNIYCHQLSLYSYAWTFLGWLIDDDFETIVKWNKFYFFMRK